MCAIDFNKMNKSEDENIHLYLIVFNAITSILFIFSEILGMSSCEYNGVIHFILGDCICRKKIYVDISIGESERENLLS